ncbi:MAG: chitobiase/beta-hexosaminidase C-terminal domain-containing protein [Lachnospiraceae bacterium]|nr:chitobiase/beta-hexosaminidase C-terminal domain-containing protein [Lachnospiraceae bacterium]
MKRGMRGFCFAVISVLLFGIPVAAHGLDDSTMQATNDGSVVCAAGDIMPVQGIEEHVDDWKVDYDCDEIQKKIESRNDDNLEGVNIEKAVAYQIKDSAIYNNAWDQYANNYVYNQLSNEKKVVWEAMDALCLEALTTQTDYSGQIGSVASSAFESNEDLADFISIYKYSNPQYFFLANGYYYGKDSNGKFYVRWNMYDNMLKGDARILAVNKFKAGIEKYKEDITYSEADEYVTVKSIHDTICDKTTYNYDSVNSSHVNEQTEYTQSAYSTFVLGKTVCTGYTMAAELLCNDAGIDCISVTSSNHAWNMVRVYDSWYQMDTTWGDQTSRIYYGYFLKSTKTYTSSTDKNYTSHMAEAMWNGYVPLCTLDSTVIQSGWAAGAISKPSEQVATPQISLGDKVTLYTDTSGATIYYTIDGTEPSSSYTRSLLYTEPFSLPETGRVKAIAVKDMYKDSVVRDATFHSVTYHLNGGTNSSRNPTCFVTDTGKQITLERPVKDGYIFKGWYTSPDFKDGTALEAIDCSVGQDYILYAKWVLECVETGKHKLVSDINAQLAGQLQSAATCTVPAVYKKYCAACHMLSDETFEYGKALGHEYKADFEWTEDGNACNITLICQHDATHTEKGNCIITSAVKKAATCKERGITAYTARYIFDGKTYTNTKDIGNIPKTDHRWNEGQITREPDGTAEGVKTYTCVKCGAEKTEVIPKKESISDSEVGTTTETTTEITAETTTEITAETITNREENKKPETPVSLPDKGEILEDNRQSDIYTVVDTKKKEVCFETLTDLGETTVTIPDTVMINGEIYKVTQISNNAFKNNKNVTKIKIGKNIKYIGKNAFKGCKKVKIIIIRSSELNARTVSGSAFKGIKKGTVIKVPKNKVSAYRKLFRKKGLSKQVKIKAY